MPKMRTLRRLSHYGRKSSIVVGRQMEKVEEYRARATECDYRAEDANDAIIRADFFVIKHFEPSVEELFDAVRLKVRGPSLP